MFRRPLGHAARLFAVLVLLASPLVALAADPKPEPKDAEPTGADFAAQGEYVGQVFTQEGNADIGIQLVALGDGKFKAVSYLGGLPGDGWDRSPRREGKGEMKDGAVVFSGEGYTCSAKDGVMTITLAGTKIADLKKVDRESSTLGAPPPEGAVVLFDGSTTDNFDNAKMTEDGLLLPGCTSHEKFGSGKLHLEFREPYMPEARDQARGNSGVYVQGRYEVQILDSFGEEESDTGCGALYSLKAPDQSMSYPPGAWQTYDIDFTAAEYKDGQKVKDPIITVKQNNVLVARKTSLPQASPQSPVAVGPEPGPVLLQNHGNPVRFRNIWFVAKPAESK